MKSKVYIFSMALLTTSVASLSAGDITGKIHFKGDAPAPKLIKFDVMCSKLHTEKAYVEVYNVDKDGGLADVFVYVKKGLEGKDIPAAPSKPALLDQIGCVYTPYILGMQQGQTLNVKTSDKLLHNVNVTELKFNRAQIPGGKDFEFNFDKEYRFLRFKCDVHPWMFAYVNVVPHPYFAVSKEDGSFSIKGLPAGDYVIEAHHRRLGKQEVKVTVTDAGGKADFTFEKTK